VHGADVPQAGDRAADGGARYPNVGPTDYYAVVAGRHYDYTSTTYALTSTTL